MPRNFNIPTEYRSPYVTQLKRNADADPELKRSLKPFEVEKEGVAFKIARHFGFCFGVENAVEIAFRAVEENPGKRIFLSSEMIHNPLVNRDLEELGVRFLMTTEGKPLISLDELTPDDVVILPAFGVTIEMYRELERRGINPKRYDTTCPFVEKVWRRSKQLGEQSFTVVIHGKPFHEETKATFSRAAIGAPSIVLRTIDEAKTLAKVVKGELTEQDFYKVFDGRYTEEFAPNRDLQRIGVVNQTTMLAEETKEVAAILKEALTLRYGAENIEKHFADTRDTLCYATSENQASVKVLIESKGDLAIVVGGFKSSNTSHLAKLCSTKLPTYHIEGAADIIDKQTIRCFDWDKREEKRISNWLPKYKSRLNVLITAGASTPDKIIDRVMNRIGEIVQ